MASAMSLQVHQTSEGSRFSKAVDMPYERDARSNAQRRNDVNAMADPSRYGVSGEQCRRVSQASYTDQELR